MARSSMDTQGAVPVPKLLGRLQGWLTLEIEKAQRADGPQYRPGRRAFSSGSLDAIQVMIR